MKVKDYNTESDIPMHDSKFNIGQKVSFGKVIVHLISDVSWDVLKNSWVYGVHVKEGALFYSSRTAYRYLESDFAPL